MIGKKSTLQNDKLWRPSASVANLRARAKIIGEIRQFFSMRDYLEVETPIMAKSGITDVYLTNIKAQFLQTQYYLQTSPEYHMKRLLAAGSGSIYQIARVFRDDELGRHHNPEFSLLEWYKLGVNHLQLIVEVDELLQHILACPPALQKTYQDAFLEICQFDPWDVSITELKRIVRGYNLHGVLPESENDADQYLFLLMSHIVEPALSDYQQPVVIYNFPISQAALAKIHDNYAERFEVYYRGIELANGFHELTDPALQLERFEKDCEQRRALGMEIPPIDHYLIDGLKQGIPQCSGVALGLDRLLMLALKESDIAAVMSFCINNA